ncbi:hypothetical protein A6A04_00425 [Paramagnetospirillum marisnigri]|uniref:Glycosyltransferase RgtA/B/C/D-like domain-containing protein n=2 Tax=Paramagnetospirillum marisnigri TaxID=1285242 RepID=A0A178MU95_9PROT|nr:hypothetical protein A6A04_00425 [Paramagnetospirillum marisnigri]
MALWLLPALFVASLFAMRDASLPFWQAFNLDPDYYYLLNGLRLVEGLSPTDVSHPGTPIQVLIAAVIRALHPLDPMERVVDAVLADPEGHLMAATTVIFLLVGASLWLMGREAFRWGGLAPALLAQSSPFLARIIVKMALHPKPEPFMVIAAALLVAVGFAALRAERCRDGHAVLAGLVMGFGICCKIHFMALGVLPLFLFDRRRVVVYAGVTLLSFGLFFAPALGSLDIWLDWLHRVFLGAGAYGDGPQTVIEPGKYVRAIWRLFSAKWFYTGAVILSLSLLLVHGLALRSGRAAPDRRTRLLLGLVAAAFATHVLIAKQPAPHYMVPALMLTGPMLALLWAISRESVPERLWRPAWAVLGVVLVVAGGNAQWRQRTELAQWSRDTQAFVMEERFAACARVYFDAASAKSFAFQRGDMNALARYSPRLEKLFPAEEYSWFIFDHTWWKQSLMRWNKPVELDAILAAHPCTVFRGNQYQRFRDLNHTMRFDDSCPVGEEMIFTLGVTCDGQPVGR